MDRFPIPAGESVVADWLDALARPSPEPGGGAASALVLATGAALVGMTAGYAQPGEARDEALGAAASVRSLALRSADEDGELSARLVEAFRSPPEHRDGLVRDAAVAAAESGVVIAGLAASLAPVLTWLGEHGDDRLMPDVAVAARLVSAAVRATAVNIRCNTTAAGSAGAEGAVLLRLREREERALRDARLLDELAEAVTGRL